MGWVRRGAGARNLRLRGALEAGARI